MPFSTLGMANTKSVARNWMFHQYIACVISEVHPPLPEEILRKAQDRKEWRKLVVDCSGVSSADDEHDEYGHLAITDNFLGSGTKHFP